MRILHIYKDYYPPVVGGIEGHLNLLATRLSERGHDVHVLVSNDKPRLLVENIEGVRVTLAPQFGRFFSAPLNYSYPKWIRRLGKKCDILHFHLPNPTATIGYQISGLKKPYIVTYHADITRQKRLNAAYGNSLKWFLHNANQIIATSDNYVRSSNVLSLFRDKCSVIPLGINSARFSANPTLMVRARALRSRYDLPIILFVGRFRHYKGLSTLIDAMKSVPAVLLLIGKGPLEAELKQQAVQTGIISRIMFLGELSDDEVNAYFHACDVFTLPATKRSEAFGIVQLEAMACGKPVVSTELGTGTSFVNCHGVTGLVVSPNDVLALSKALNELIAHPEKRIIFGQNGLKRVRERFSVGRMVEATLSVYKAVLNGTLE